MVEALVFLYGAVLGSFFSALAYRLPRKLSLFTRSICGHCNKSLKFYDLIPIISFLFLRGKCRYCNAKITNISLEFILPIVFLLIYYFLGLSYLSILYMCLSAILITIIYIDIEFLIIPDGLQLIVAILAIIINDPDSVYNGICYFLVALSIYCIFKFIRKKEGMGFGDVKLFFSVGCFLTIEQLPVFLFFAGLFGILTGIFVKKREFPFAPALIFSLYLNIIFNLGDFY